MDDWRAKKQNKTKTKNKEENKKHEWNNLQLTLKISDKVPIGGNFIDKTF